eukprot:GHVR01051761.1.p2 GENE.GHVR01051761.1~~GHVR01051761.1.p2  ORF type:complete len:185 (+),score=57.81 GHVR01051761.1:68-622(+)
MAEKNVKTCNTVKRQKCKFVGNRDELSDVDIDKNDFITKKEVAFLKDDDSDLSSESEYGYVDPRIDKDVYVEVEKNKGSLDEYLQARSLAHEKRDIARRERRLLSRTAEYSSASDVGSILTGSEADVDDGKITVEDRDDDDVSIHSDRSMHKDDAYVDAIERIKKEQQRERKDVGSILKKNKWH